MRAPAPSIRYNPGRVMNTRAVRFLLGGLCLVLAAALLVPASVSFAYDEGEVVRGFLLSSLLVGAVGGALMLTGRGSLRHPTGQSNFFQREAIAVAALGWAVAGVAGALPFLLCGTTSSVVDAVFESMSAFTTTGSSILDGDVIDSLPHGVNFWRCFAQWVGGIGIVLVFVAVLPSGGRSLFRAEGIDRQTGEARARRGAVALLRVYVVLTALCIGLFILAGLDVFDATAHAFTSISTGGFSTRGASLGHYDAPLVEVVSICFMIAGGVNFALWEAFGRGGIRHAWAGLVGSTELRTFLVLLSSFVLAVTLVLWFWGGSNGQPGSDLPDYSSFLLSLRHAAFNVTSLTSTTGLANVDFDRWPNFARVLLMVASFVGACGGSTGGGIKVFRILVVARAVAASIRSHVRPRAVIEVHMDGRRIDSDEVATVTRYFCLWILAAILGTVALSALGSTPTGAITGVIATLNTTGPGLAALGPNSNFGHLNDASKLVCCALMVLGRLEFYTVCALCMRSFWRS
jgi:trk system potassium uptake protein TrkH